MKSRKSWREKMETPGLPKLVEMSPRMQTRFGQGMMLIPSARDIERQIKTIQLGSITTVAEIRDVLAAKYSANLTCPLVTGIFVRIVAEAAAEDEAAGRSAIAPYWRVLKDDGSLNPKFPGGADAQAERLRAEGHRIVAGAGKRGPRVAGPVVSPTAIKKSSGKTRKSPKSAAI